MCHSLNNIRASFNLKHITPRRKKRARVKTNCMKTVLVSRQSKRFEKITMLSMFTNLFLLMVDSDGFIYLYDGPKTKVAAKPIILVLKKDTNSIKS